MTLSARERQIAVDVATLIQYYYNQQLGPIEDNYFPASVVFQSESLASALGIGKLIGQTLGAKEAVLLTKEGLAGTLIYATGTLLAAVAGDPKLNQGNAIPTVASAVESYLLNSFEDDDVSNVLGKLSFSTPAALIKIISLWSQS